MNKQQIAQLYDSFPPDQQDMPKSEFVRKALDALDPVKLAHDADAIVRGRIQKAQIDIALEGAR